MRRHVRHSKHDPLVDEVEIVEANSEYAHVKFPDSRVTTVSLRHLAPLTSENADFNSSVPQPWTSAEVPDASVPLETVCSDSHVDSAPQKDSIQEPPSA